MKDSQLLVEDSQLLVEDSQLLVEDSQLGSVLEVVNLVGSEEV